MLYVFRVDTGLMLTFDMNLAMESVSKLKEAIATKCNIPEDKQVMLISGGESLDPKARVCSYSAGTDTNPIFLFSLMAIESATPPSASVNYGSESDLQDQVEGSLDMPPTYETVVARAQLALQIHEVGREVLHICERLVHDQHLQHQGWAAAVANLEDITSAFKKSCDALWKNLDDFGLSRDKYIDMLEIFPETINLLSKIPLLPCLAGDKISFATFAAFNSASSSPTDMMYEPGLVRSRSSLTLLEWISRQDTRSSVEQMIQQCQQGLDQFLPPVKETLKREMACLLEDLSNLSMKEVKGLEDRLYGLEQLMYGTRKLVQEQKDMAQGFVKNQNRASNLRDPSILPDLCQSHRRQLLVMLRTHQKLWDSLRRCTAAKDELGTNFHTRLRWIMFMEKKLRDKDNKLMIHQATLWKLQRRLSILEQMAAAPGIYASAVVEVVRRRSFSKNFLDWAGTLAEESHLIHQAELGKRQQFSSAIDQHFLKMLFPGFEDVPPPFATEAPHPFDTRLPPITVADVKYLSSQVPELSDKLRLPETEESMERLSTASLKGGSASALSPTQYMPSPTEPHQQLEPPCEEKEQSGEDCKNLSDSASQTEALTAADAASSTAKDDMCASDIVVLTHEMSIQAAEGATVTAFGTVQPAEPSGKDTDKSTEKVDREPSPERTTEKTKSADHSPSSTKSELTQSVEVLEEDEEDEFLSLQPPEQEPTALVVPQPTVIVEPKLKTSTSSSSADLAPPPAGSGMPCLSTSPTKMDRKEHHKGTPDTSPSLEEVNSEGFTTADFYIDESMPSSMTESPPTKKMVAELQMVLQEKSAMLDAKERELEQHRRTIDTAREKLNSMEDNFKVLHDVAEKGRLKLKCDVLSIEKQIQKDKEEFNSFMDSVTKRLVQVIEKFETQQNEERSSIAESTKADYEKKLAELSEKLEVETQKLHDAQREIDIYHKHMKERDEKYESLQHEMATALTDAEEKWQTEVGDTKKRLILEHEVEMDKVQAELRSQLEVSEEHLSQASAAVLEKETMLSTLKKELEELSEKLQTEFQEEKKEMRRLLEEEHQEKVTQQCEELKESLSKAHQDEMDACKEEHQKVLMEECEKLTAELEDKSRQEMEELKNESEQKHKETVDNLERKHQETLRELTELNNQVDELHEKAVVELKEEHRGETEQLLLQKQTELKSLKSKHEQTLTELKQQHELKLAELESEHLEALNELTRVHQTAVSELREKLTLEKLSELESLQKHVAPIELEVSQTESAGSEGAERSIPCKQHEEIISQIKAAFEQQKSEAVQKAVFEQQAQHETTMDQLLGRTDRPESSANISSTAEKQIAFNEALSRVVGEKDKVIEELRTREAALEKRQREDQETLADILSEKMGEDEQRDVAVTLAKDREKQIRSLQTKHDEELAAAQAQIQQLQEQAFMSTSVASSVSVVSASSSPLKVAPHASAPLSQSVFSQSPMGSSIMPFSDSACATSMYEERIQELRTNLKSKEDEVSKLQKKVMEMSISPSSRAFIQDKVSITTCNVGDVVLLCLDERHDHYVVFNMGTTLHFLHSDCLDLLGLKPALGEGRKSWVLAEIIDKEYCQAKKAQNRFKVPLGTKFYRVKAQAWDREAALQREREGASPGKSH